MNTVDLFLKRYSYKFPKGYVDINDKQDLVILESIFKKLDIDVNLNEQSKEEIILTEEEEKENNTSITKKEVIDILEKEELNDEQIKVIFSVVSGIKYKEPVIEYIKSKGKGPSQEAAGIYNFLIETGEINEFAEYIKKPKKYSDIPKNGDFHDIFKPFSKELIDYLLTREPAVGGVSTGKGEILLSIMLEDVEDARGGGDINAGGKPVEVKNKGAKPMGQSFQFNPNTIESVYQDIEKKIDLPLEDNEDEVDMFDNNLDEMSIKDIAAKTGKIRPFGKFAKVYEYLKSDYPDKVEEFNKALKDSLQKRYIGLDLNDLDLKNFEKDNTLDWMSLEIFIGKKIVEKYIEDENFEEIIFLNDKIKKYSILSSKEVIDEIGKKIKLWFPDGVPRWTYKDL